MRARLERWWDEHSPPRRAARRRAQSAALLASIPLEAADRVASALLGVPPAATPIDVSTPAAIDAYVKATLSRAGGIALGDEGEISLLLEAAEDGDEEVVGHAFWDDLRRKPGELTTFAAEDGRSHPSPMHAVLAHALTHEDQVALASAPDTWTSERSLPRTTLPAREPPLTLRAGPTMLEGIVLAPLALVSMLLVAMAAVPLFGDGDLWLLVVIVPAALLAYGLAWRSWVCLWLAPRARRLAIDADGLLHPRTRQRVAWETLRAAARGRLVLRLELSDGTRVFVPDELFLDPAAADRYLRGRVTRARVPYR